MKNQGVDSDTVVTGGWGQVFGGFVVSRPGRVGCERFRGACLGYVAHWTSVHADLVVAETRSAIVVP